MTATAPASPSPGSVIEVYDDFTAPGYTLERYASRWATPFGLGEMAVRDTRSFDGDGFHVAAVPFRTASDEGVLDHLKYFAVSTRTFPVPVTGSVRFDSTIIALTPGTTSGRVVRGTYTGSGAPYEAVVREGQQAGAVLNIVDFATGQLFDWFVAGSTAYALIERLPSTVTGNAAGPASPDWVGRDKMYTQIVAEFPVGRGPHEVGIRFSRDPATGQAEWFLDGAPVARVAHVGVPLDRQGVPFTGTYPSLGPGEEVAPKIDGLSLAHGLFSLVDAFPFQHPEAPAAAVSLPVADRAWGQGAAATFSGFRVETREGVPWEVR